LPAGPEWSYEVKWDGYRALAEKKGSAVRLISRNNKDLTRDYPSIVRSVAALPVKRLVLDGEIVALTNDGRPSFQALQHRSTAKLVLVYYAFDLLSLDGASWLRQPLEARRERLAAIVDGSAVLRSSPLEGEPDAIEAVVRELKLEGVVAKRRDSVYRPGQRTEDWIKVKFSPRQEFVIGGYRPNGRSLDALVVGYYEERGSLTSDRR
jgi:bifunctional non-homologous end joining protein LigD